MGNPLRVKDFNGNIIRTEYNGLNLPEKVYDPAPFDSQFNETTYYKTGKVKSIKNRRGYATIHEFDALNREVRVTDARGHTVETTYNKAGNVKTVKDKRGIITENFYDDLYRLVRVEKAGLRLKTNEYDGVGNLTAVIDANNNRTEHAYNGRNLLETTKHPDNTMEIRTYDGVGNLLTLTNEENKITTYTYDKENRQTSVEFAGEKTTKAYDAVGNLVSITRPKDNRRTMTYDAFKRLTSVVDDPGSLNLITRYRYDANGNMRYQYDPKGYYVEFTYDNLSRKKEHIQHKGTGNLITRYTSYDEEGNLKEMIDPNGQRFTYAYDELNRQTDAYYPDVDSPFNKIIRIQKEYDPNNNITAITETKMGPDGSTITDTTVNHYDEFDRLDDSTQRGLTIDYSYDANGNRTQVSTPSGTTTYTFDSRNRIKTATVDGLVTVYAYYPDGKEDTITHPNGTEVKYTYHPSNRVETVTHWARPSIISSYSYEYDKNGNRISQIELQDGLTETTTYQYDTIDRLKEFTITNGTSTTVTEYTFDGYNRRTERVMENGVLVKSRTYSYDETNWLMRLDYTDNPQSETRNGSITYTYDNNGNTTRKTDSSLPNENTKFVYDSRNQLVQVTRGPPGSETVLGQYDYNSSGLRVRHRQSERGDVDYYYDDDAVIEEHNVADGSLLAHYRYADRLISLETRNLQSETQYYHHDALGSIVNLTTPTGAVLVSYILDPWGHIRRQSGFSINRHIFTGQEHDENTGLIYFGARYYDPDIARFITQDMYLGEENTPPSLNRYLYAYSNPTVYVDLIGYQVSGEFKKQLEEEGLYWSPKALEIIQGRLGIKVSPERFAAWATAETMATSLGVIIIETADGMREFAKGVVTRAGEMNKFFERHERFAKTIHYQISHGRRISDPRVLDDPEFQEAFADYAKINPSAINVQFEIPSRGLMGVLETREGREDVKNWFKREFDFTDESVSSFERAKRGWNLILALWVAGEAAKPLETGLRNLAKAGSESVTLRGGLVERIYQGSALRSEVGTVGKDVGKATVQDIAPKGRIYSAIEPGPLPRSIAETFSGGRYTERVLEKETIFYRVHGGKAGVIGRRGTFVSPEPQVGGLQSLIDLGLRPEWGNTAAGVSKIKVPAGTRVYEGIVSSQGGPWVGGKVQVFIPKISPEWVVP
jgi:RHS repeat-associated protein